MDVPDTINLATTYAGYRDCVIASPSLAKAHKLQVVQNLEGIFKTKQDVYSYGLKNMYPKLTKRLVAAIATKAGETEVNAIFRDYIVATAAPCVWLDPDNPDELPLLRQILDTLDPNSAYMGWFPYGHETNGVTEASQKSLYVVASDFLYNGSLMSGLKKFFPVSATSAPAAPVRRIENKMYVSLTWSEGDNVQYCQRRLRQLWDDRLRGKLPMGWTITPLLADVAPNILNYFQTTATANDTFVVGPSGAGYTNPISWPLGNLEKFLNQTKRYSQETGIGSTMWVYNRVNGKPQPISTGIASAYKSQLSPKLLGIAVDVGDQAENASAVENIDGLAVAGLLQMDSLETGFAELRNISESQFNGSRPLFITCSLTAWNFTVGDVVGMVGQLGEKFEIVRPDEQFKMINMMNEGNRFNGTSSNEA